MPKPGIKRFYKAVETKDGKILLDGRPIKTPGGHHLVAPAQNLAEAIAAEWRAQAGTIKPDTMPLTKALNTALDRIAPNRDAIVADLAGYAAADLLCYRAAAPEVLARRQRAAWDPWLDWAAERLGARLGVTEGVTHIAQSDTALARVREAIAAHDDHHLVVLHAGITITGSSILGLAFTDRALTADEALAAAQVDETYQAEFWGSDAEAEKARASRRADLKAAEAYLKLLRD